METKQIKCMLVMQSSIAKMLIFSQKDLPTDEQLIEAVVHCVKHMEHEEGFEVDKELIVTMCELALGIKMAIKNPEDHLLKMITDLF